MNDTDIYSYDIKFQMIYSELFDRIITKQILSWLRNDLYLFYL